MILLRDENHSQAVLAHENSKIIFTILYPTPPLPTPHSYCNILYLHTHSSTIASSQQHYHTHYSYTFTYIFSFFKTRKVTSTHHPAQSVKHAFLHIHSAQTYFNTRNISSHKYLKTHPNLLHITSTHVQTSTLVLAPDLMSSSRPLDQHFTLTSRPYKHLHMHIIIHTSASPHAPKHPNIHTRTSTPTLPTHPLKHFHTHTLLHPRCYRHTYTHTSPRA